MNGVSNVLIIIILLKGNYQITQTGDINGQCFNIEQLNIYYTVLQISKGSQVKNLTRSTT